MTFLRHCLPATLATLAFGAFLPIAAAHALPAGTPRVTGAASRPALVMVHADWSDEDEHAWRKRRHHHHAHGLDDGEVVVEAPFTRVEHGRRVVVDAPFAHVYADRYGRHIVAPFVDLRLPR